MGAPGYATDGYYIVSRSFRLLFGSVRFNTRKQYQRSTTRKGVTTT